MLYPLTHIPIAPGLLEALTAEGISLTNVLQRRQHSDPNRHASEGSPLSTGLLSGSIGTH